MAWPPSAADVLPQTVSELCKAGRLPFIPQDAVGRAVTGGTYHRRPYAHVSSPERVSSNHSGLLPRPRPQESRVFAI